MNPKVPQSQQSLMDQLDALEKLAVAHGLYDAHDYLRKAREPQLRVVHSTTTDRTIVFHGGYSYHFDRRGREFVKVVNTKTLDCPNPIMHIHALAPTMWAQIQQVAISS